MAQKIVSLPEIGDVVLAKRRGTRNLRLSVSSDGRVRVGLPAWAPYQAGINFALSRKDWIKKHTNAIPQIDLKDGKLIGKSYRLKFIQVSTALKPRSRLSDQQILISFSPHSNPSEIQRIATAACERALKKDAEKLLTIRLAQLARQHGFSYTAVKIKRLRSRWGSCSSQKVITLNYYLIQLPWPLIDYVILHELTHTEHLHHGKDFWAHLTMLLPHVKLLRRQIKTYKPVLAASTIA